MQQTRETSGVVEVDGDTYEWEIRRQPRPLAGGKWEGLALELRLKDFPRAAVVLFPMPMRANGRPDHEKQQVKVESVRNAVASAIEAGWNPTSRGKVMVFDVDADGH